MGPIGEEEDDDDESAWLQELIDYNRHVPC